MRSLLAALLVLSVLAAPAAARIDPPTGLPSQGLRSPDTRDAAMHVPYGSPPASDGDTPWALLGLALPVGGAAWVVRRRTARVHVAA